jgi:hypothetical protein
LTILDVHKVDVSEKENLVKISVIMRAIYMGFPRSFRDKYYDQIVGDKSVKIAVMELHLREGN